MQLPIKIQGGFVSVNSIVKKILFFLPACFHFPHYDRKSLKILVNSDQMDCMDYREVRNLISNSNPILLPVVLTVVKAAVLVIFSLMCLFYRSHIEY